jgi:hypothetical protein
MLRIGLGVILVLFGVAGLAASGLSYWQCFVVADDDLPEAREQDQKKWAQVRQLLGQQREAIQQRKTAEMEGLMKKWDDITQQTEQTIRDKSTTWRIWHFVRGTFMLLFGIGMISRGAARFWPQRGPTTASDTATDGAPDATPDGAS